MKTRASEIWSSIVEGFWFLPAVMALSSIFIAAGTLWVDARFDIDWGTGRGLIYSGGVSGGREVLSTIAGSMITVTGVVFSITIVTLSLASNQYGPRLLRNFMSDRANQLVLGTFISTFTYCLIILRTLRDDEDTVIVPEISISIGVLLALVSIGVLIYFIHHISDSIQASSILSGVGADLDRAIDRMYPERIGQHPETIDRSTVNQPGAAYGSPPSGITSANSGYVRAVDPDGVMGAAREYDAVVRLDCKPGAFVFAGTRIATIWSAGEVGDDLEHRIRQSFIIGRQRTPFQDIDYLMSQLLQPALLALSTGVNNSLVAITAIDWVGASLAKLAGRREPSDHRYDDEGTLRVLSQPETFASLFDATFNPLRESARSNTLVTIHLLECILDLTSHVSTGSQSEVLRRQTDLIETDSRDGIPNEFDRSRIQSLCREIDRALGVTSR